MTQFKIHRMEELNSFLESIKDLELSSGEPGMKLYFHLGDRLEVYPEDKIAIWDPAFSDEMTVSRVNYCVHKCFLRAILEPIEREG